MMEEKLNSDLAKELLTIISYCEDTFINNIPSYVIEKISDYAADSEKDFYVDKNKSLSNQNISEDCKNLLSLLYFTYCLDSESKNKMIDIWFKNESIKDNNVN